MVGRFGTKVPAPPGRPAPIISSDEWRNQEAAMSQTLIDPEELTATAVDEATPKPQPSSAGTDRLSALEQQVERTRVRRDGWTLSVFVFSAIALVAAIVAVGFGSRAIDEPKRNTASPAASPAAARATAGPPTPT